MNRIHLVVLWHMHQPQYRDPETGCYVLPWTRLHATKDYYGMVKLMEEAPGFHATFNMVPSLCMQLEEYASGNFREPWFALAFKHADELTREDKAELLARAFQVNHDRLLTRWPRFLELFEWSRGAVLGLPCTYSREAPSAREGGIVDLNIAERLALGCRSAQHGAQLWSRIGYRSWCGPDHRCGDRCQQRCDVARFVRHIDAPSMVGSIWRYPALVPQRLLGD